MEPKIVLVSGCYDLIHGGHIAFFKTASQFGRLYVAVGSDRNVLALKGKATTFSEAERVYLVKAVRFVEDAFVASGSGMLDFAPDLERLRPDVFVVNADGHTPEKEALCTRLGIEYKVLERIPDEGLPARASSSIKRGLQFPYRLCIAGGWMDQPWISEHYPGSVVVAQLQPTIEFNDRSGMATSSRRVALRIWGDQYPAGDPIENAKILFGAENPPGSEYIAGSQDHLGLLNPGVSRLYYDGTYWPRTIDSTTGTDVCDWLSGVLQLVPLAPRPSDYDPIKERHITRESVRELAEAGEHCWQSILRKDVEGLGRSMTATFRAWRKLLPYTVPDPVLQELETRFFPHYPGATTSGSGGGYVVVASERPIEGALSIKVRY